MSIKTVQKGKFPVIGFIKDPTGVAALYPGKKQGKDLVYMGKQKDAEHGGKGMLSGSCVVPWLYRPVHLEGWPAARCVDIYMEAIRWDNAARLYEQYRHEA